MATFIVLHIPHIIPAFVAMGFLGRFRATSARLGLLSLPLLVMAVATGLWLYTVALRDDRPSALAIWLHVICSVLALALVTYKVAESGRARLRRGLDPARFLTDGLSLVLAALLLVTGAALIFAPGSSSATAHAHLIASAWWMTLFGVHIMRYLGRSLDATFHGKSAPD